MRFFVTDLSILSVDQHRSRNTHVIQRDASRVGEARRALEAAHDVVLTLTRFAHRLNLLTFVDVTVRFDERVEVRVEARCAGDVFVSADVVLRSGQRLMTMRSPSLTSLNSLFICASLTGQMQPDVPFNDPKCL